MSQSKQPLLDSDEGGKTAITPDPAIYRVYVAYGLSCLTAFSSILSTLAFFINEMPDRNPGFFVGFGFNILQIVFLVVYLLYGRRLPFLLMHNAMIVVTIPLMIGLPVLVRFAESEEAKLRIFLVILAALGMVNAFQQGAVCG